MAGCEASRWAVACGSMIVVVTTDDSGPLLGVAGLSMCCWNCVSVLGVSGPGSKFRDCCPLKTPVSVPENTGNSEMSACGFPTGSHGIQMLYDAPSCVGLKCFLSCSAVNAKRLVGTWLAFCRAVSSKA